MKIRWISIDPWFKKVKIVVSRIVWSHGSCSSDWPHRIARSLFQKLKLISTQYSCNMSRRLSDGLARRFWLHWQDWSFWSGWRLEFDRHTVVGGTLSCTFGFYIARAPDDAVTWCLTAVCVSFYSSYPFSLQPELSMIVLYAYRSYEVLAVSDVFVALRCVLSVRARYRSDRFVRVFENQSIRARFLRT